MIFFVVDLLSIGFMPGGRDQSLRTVLGLATAQRNVDDASRLSNDQGWIKRTPNDLQQAEEAHPKVHNQAVPVPNKHQE